MLDPLTGATAFATIVQLLAIYRQDRGAREDLDHRDFVDWLEQHRHEDIKELITHTYHLQSQVDDLLRQDHAAILEKLDEVNKIAASILARLEGFTAVAEIVMPDEGIFASDARTPAVTFTFENGPVYTAVGRSVFRRQRYIQPGGPQILS